MGDFYVLSLKIIKLSLTHRQSNEAENFSAKEYFTYSLLHVFFKNKLTLFYCKMLTLHLCIIIIMCHLIPFFCRQWILATILAL